MNVEKRTQYIDSLYAALHTISGRVEEANLSAAINEPTVKTCYRKQTKTGEYHYIQLNPNKIVPGSMIKNYSVFTSVLDTTLQHIEATSFQITRADLSFNSDHENDFELFKKLNRLLICCIAETYNVTNCYASTDLWSDRSLSVAIKNDTIEAENYNKELESKGLTEAKNRLELRSKRMKEVLEDEFMVNWFNRLDQAIKQFGAVQQHYNKELQRIWIEDAAKPAKERDFVSLTAFILRYKQCIFTRKQLVDLLTLINVENPKSKAKKFKERHSIEFFSLTDLKLIVKALKTATKNYFYN